MFKPEVQGMGEFKAGPGDVAQLVVKVRGNPDPEIRWYKKIGDAETEGGEDKMENIDPKADKKYER